MDIFESDAFAVRRLTQAINEIKFVPGRIGQLGLFETQSVDTTIIQVEKKGDILILVPPTPRGGPGTTVDIAKRDLRPLNVPHFEINDAIYAESIQNVRAFGQEQALETMVGKVAEKQVIHVNSMSATEEYARMGAVKGIVTYADSSTLNLFTEFGVVQESEIDFALTAASPAEGALRNKCASVTRAMQGILDGLPFTGIWAFCGDNFFDALLAHKEVRDSYKGWNQAQILRESYIGPNRMSYGIFEFGGIVWENYRGARRRDLVHRQRQGSSVPGRLARSVQDGLCPGRLRGHCQHHGPAALYQAVPDAEQQGPQPRHPDERLAVLLASEGAAEGQEGLTGKRGECARPGLPGRVAGHCG